MYRIFGDLSDRVSAVRTAILVEGHPSDVDEFHKQCFRDYPGTPRNPGGFIDVFDFDRLIPRHPDTPHMVALADLRGGVNYNGPPLHYFQWALSHEFRDNRSPVFARAMAKWPSAPTDNRNAARLYCYMFHHETTGKVAACLRFMKETGCQSWQQHHMIVWGATHNAQGTQWVIKEPTVLLFYFDNSAAFSDDLRNEMYTKFRKLSFTVCSSKGRRSYKREAGERSLRVDTDKMQQELDALVEAHENRTIIPRL